MKQHTLAVLAAGAILGTMATTTGAIAEPIVLTQAAAASGPFVDSSGRIGYLYVSQRLMSETGGQGAFFSCDGEAELVNWSRLRATDTGCPEDSAWAVGAVQLPAEPFLSDDPGYMKGELPAEVSLSIDGRPYVIEDRAVWGLEQLVISAVQREIFVGVYWLGDLFAGAGDVVNYRPFADTAWSLYRQP